MYERMYSEPFVALCEVYSLDAACLRFCLTVKTKEMKGEDRLKLAGADDA